MTGPYHLTLDTAGNRPLRALRALLTPDGTAVLVGGEAAAAIRYVAGGTAAGKVVVIVTQG